MDACLCVVVLSFFFFKQKTAYEMRISDWSSDVCSSDLAGWRRGERWVIPIAWLGSVGGWLIAWGTGFPAMPAVALLLFAIVLRRAATGTVARPAIDRKSVV